MHLEIHPWENTLLRLAHEVGHSQAPDHEVRVTPELLASAYEYCSALTSACSRSFYVASALLPKSKRHAARALYAFCRTTDDLVDNVAPGEASALLEAWRRRLGQSTPPADDLVAVAWADARRRYSIPWLYAEQLVDGVERDTWQSRYASFDDLAAYSYGVASTVGLMSMHIVGYNGAQAIPYAIKLGVAMQLTNILRDVGEDWRKGRLYLPQDELSAFDVHEGEIAAGMVTPAWRQFMRFQIERTRRLYDEAWPGIAMLDADGRFAIAAAADLYRAILSRIEENDYNTFTSRASVPGFGKLAMLPGVWVRSRRSHRTQRTSRSANSNRVP